MRQARRNISGSGLTIPISSARKSASTCSRSPTRSIFSLCVAAKPFVTIPSLQPRFAERTYQIECAGEKLQIFGAVPECTPHRTGRRGPCVDRHAAGDERVAPELRARIVNRQREVFGGEFRPKTVRLCDAVRGIAVRRRCRARPQRYRRRGAPRACRRLYRRAAGRRDRTARCRSCAVQRSWTNAKRTESECA